MCPPHGLRLQNNGPEQGVVISGAQAHRDGHCTYFYAKGKERLRQILNFEFSILNFIAVASGVFAMDIHNS
jgi:hypothetical protein